MVNDFLTLKNKYYILYKSWKKVYCPALKDHVYFTNWGWTHIVSSKSRTKKEVKKRLSILPFAKKLLNKTTVIFKKRKQYGYQCFEFREEMEGVLISVIVFLSKKSRHKRYFFVSTFKI